MLLESPNGVTIDANEPHAAILLRAGWTRAEAPEPEPVDLTVLTVSTLRALCDERGIDAPRRATKTQLVELLS